MKKVLTFLDDNFPFLLLIAIFACYEYSMIHFLINIILGIFNNTIERSSSPFTYTGTTQCKTIFCIGKSLEYSLHGHIISFIILLIFGHMAKDDTTFSKKAYKILVIVTVISLLLIFCLRLFSDLWWVKAISK